MTTSALVPGLLPVAINGHPYLADPSIKRETVQVIRQQSDTSTEAGEQSLTPYGLWRRSQESWHHGAGQDFLDGRQGDVATDPHRFRSSKGVDPWTKGQVSLLHPTIKVFSSASSNLYLAVSNPGGIAILYVSDGTEVYEAALPYSLLNTLALQRGTGWTATNATIATISEWFKLTATAAAVISAISPTGTNGIPVEPGREYGMAFQANYLSGGSPKTPTLTVTWYTAAGASISSSTTTAAAPESVSFTHHAVAPPTAAFAAVTVSYTAASAIGEAHEVRTASFGPLDDTGTFGGPDTWTALVINAGQAAQAVQSIASDGTYLWAALGTSGLHRNREGVGSTADVPAAPASGQVSLVGYANGFLLAAGSAGTDATRQNSLWLVTGPLDVTPALSLIKTHPNVSFAWTGIGPGRNCAPGDQLVETTNRGRVRIDELVPGQDKLLCYDEHSQRVFHYRRGTGRRYGGVRSGFDFIKAVRPFTGDLMVMTTDETRVRVTPNHRVPVRWSKDAAKAHCVYLMRRGDWWRIGKSNLHYVGRFGPAARCITEKADAVWLLGVYETAAEALYAEEYYSAAYGITQAIFEWGTRYQGNRIPAITNEMLKELHERLAAGGSGERARRLIADMGLEVEYPIWGANDEEKRCGLNLAFKIRACNLVSGWMEVATYSGYTTEKLPWQRVTITREAVVSLPVYSLEVEQYHSYIGDGQALFNCVYAWGNSGGNGEVYKVLFDPNTGSLSTAASPATYLPDGETIHALQFYAGGIIMGTGKGVRIGTADGAGNIDYGPLVPTLWPVRCLEPQDRYCWFGWTKYDASNSGLGRIDLGFLTDTLTPAWASDLMTADTSTGDTVACVTFAPYGYQAAQRPPVRVFTVAGEGAYIEDPGSRELSGTLSTGTIRFSTSEPKTTRSLDVRHHALPAGGPVAAEMQRDTSGTWTSVGSSSVTGSYGPATPLDLQDLNAEAMEFRFTLDRPDNNGTDYTRSPEMTRWTAKVLPLPSTIDETFTFTLHMKSTVDTTAADGQPYRMDVQAEMTYLKGLEQSRAIVDFQVGNETFEGYVVGSHFLGENWEGPQRRFAEGKLQLQVQTLRG